jgi:hypothetical protein
MNNITQQAPMLDDITHQAPLMNSNRQQAKVPADITHQGSMLEDITFFVPRVVPTLRDRPGRHKVIAFQYHIQRLEKWILRLEMERNLLDKMDALHLEL